MGTYRSVNGKAPSGLKAGDKVVTGGGTYTITGVKSDGSYNSVKSSNDSKYTYKGSYNTPSGSSKKTGSFKKSGLNGILGGIANGVSTIVNNKNTIKDYVQNGGNKVSKDNPNANYGGYSFDTNYNYQTDIDNYAKAGDYQSASRAEALRNAKINYLNSIGQNKNNLQTSNLYNYSSFSDLPDNWNTANLNGNTIYKKNDGYYDKEGKLLGNGYNYQTNAYTFNNRSDAENYVKDYLASINKGWSNYQGYDLSDYIDNNLKSSISNSIINAAMNGTLETWKRDNADKIDSYLQSALAQKQYEDEMERLEEERRQMILDSYVQDDGSLDGSSTTAQNTYANNMNDYMNYIIKQMGNRRVNLL